MSKFKVKPENTKVLLKEMRECVKIYKRASEAERLLPSARNNLEMVRYSLGSILIYLNDEEIRNSYPPDVQAEIDEAMCIKVELATNIARMWGSEVRV